MRALWPSLLGRPGLRDTAYALEAWLQELFFIFGPLIVAAIASVAPAWAALVAAAAFAGVGTIWFALAPPVRAAGGSRRAPSRAGALGSKAVRTVMITCVALGAAFGVVEVTMPAFGEAHGSRAQGGFALACFALGSLVGGIWIGTRPAARRLGLRFALSLALLAVALVPPLVAPNLPVMCALMLLAGMPIAPAFAASYGLVGELDAARYDDRGVRLAHHGHRHRARDRDVGRRLRGRAARADRARSRWPLPAPAWRRSSRSPALRRWRSRSRYRNPMAERGSAPYRRDRRERQGRPHDRRRSSRGEGVPQTLLVRDAARAPDLPGAEVVVADFTDGDSVRAALRPGDRVFMVSVHEAVEARIAAHQSFVDAAADVGVGLLAYLSIVKPSPTSAFPHGHSHYATEQMILASGLPYAFLRMNLFLDDLALWFDPDGVCRGPGGDGRVALISREDTAAVSAGVLAGRATRTRPSTSRARSRIRWASSRRSATSSSG